MQHRPLVQFVRQVEVPLASLRCNINRVASLQGFGGQPISELPACRAFALYLDDPQAARQFFTEWLTEQVFRREIWRYSKRDGGMATGSMRRAVNALQRDRGLVETGIGQAPRPIVEEAIAERVRYYFTLFESIRSVGFEPGRGPRIRCWPRRGTRVLINGHHRAAALHVLRHQSVEVEVHYLYRMLVLVDRWTGPWRRARRQ
jgi:hypothetical protein